ncbi:MAG TPA: type II toxin-antitoxin system VapC family toxin [Acidimicrobiales bacterium]|nr:type II toxin-antitoxin system VapC family toxin [Acidimicrobiales bacterium]
MILVDTSVWIDYLRRGNPVLAQLLSANEVLGHSWVIGELSLGGLSGRGEVLDLLAALPQAVVATESELIAAIDANELFGRGIGWVDAQLLVSARLTSGAKLWSRDRKLAAVAEALDVAHS